MNTLIVNVCMALLLAVRPAHMGAVIQIEGVKTNGVYAMSAVPVVPLSTRKCGC